MPNKFNAYIDLAKLQGAYRHSLKGRDGKLHDCLIINLGESRVKPGRDPAKLHLSLTLVPNRDGKDDFGQTHWITEPTTQEERQRPDAPKLPILGNAREFDDNSKPATHTRATTSRSTTHKADDHVPGADDDEIPF